MGPSDMDHGIVYIEPSVNCCSHYGRACELWYSFAHMLIN